MLRARFYLDIVVVEVWNVMYAFVAVWWLVWIRSYFDCAAARAPRARGGAGDTAYRLFPFLFQRIDPFPCRSVRGGISKVYLIGRGAASAKGRDHPSRRAKKHIVVRA